MTKSSTSDGRTLWTRIARAGSVALAALIVAVGLLVSAPPLVASAVFATPPVFTAPIQAAGLTETWTIGGWRGSAPNHLTSATVTFPVGFVIPPRPTVTVTGNGVACAVQQATTANQSVLIEVRGACESSSTTPRQSISIAGITNPATPGTVAAAGFKLTTSVDAEQSASSDVVIWGMTARTLCYAPGGQSRAQVEFTSTADTVAGSTGSGATAALSFATTAGTIAQTPSLDSGLGVPTPILSQSSTAIATVAAAIPGRSVALVDVAMPFSTGNATVTVRVTPAGGGASVLLGSSDVTFADGVCTPPAAVVPPPVVAPPAAVVPPVVAVPPPAAAAATFTGGTIAPVGISIVSFTGTTAQLNTAGVNAKVVSVSAAVGGKLLTYVVGAPDFVNAEFNTVFSTKGLSDTLVVVKT